MQAKQSVALIEGEVASVRDEVKVVQEANAKRLSGVAVVEPCEVVTSGQVLYTGVCEKWLIILFSVVYRRVREVNISWFVYRRLRVVSDRGNKGKMELVGEGGALRQ